MKMPLLLVLQQLTARKSKIRNSNQKHFIVLLVQIFKQPFTYSIVYELKTAEKFEKRQPNIFKNTCFAK